jgi:uncharacterized protein
MDRELLQQVILEQHTLGLPQRFVQRTVLEKIDTYLNTPFVVIVTGIRRCGKSTVLQWLRKQGQEQDYYLNFDDDRLVDFQLADFQMLYELFIEMYGKQKTFFFDEIQNIPQWERFIRRLHDHGNKVYITGSNASMFSQELGTRLTGRYLSVTMYPYSFLEYVNAKSPKLLPYQGTSEKKARLRRLFSQYMDDGGLPEYIQHQTTDYLHTLFENIIYKDVIVRYRLTNERLVRSLLHFLASNVGKNVTFNSLRKLLNLGSSNTVAEYCQYFQNSFLCFLVNNFSASLKRQYGYAKKVYWIDSGLAKQVGFRLSEDRGRMLENIVYLELLRREKEIYCYQEKKECDFIIKSNNEITCAIQVTVSTAHPSTRQREINGLLMAMQTFNLDEGYILTESEEEALCLEIDGRSVNVFIKPVWRWLLMLEACKK